LYTGKETTEITARFAWLCGKTRQNLWRKPKLCFRGTIGHLEELLPEDLPEVRTEPVLLCSGALLQAEGEEVRCRTAGSASGKQMCDPSGRSCSCVLSWLEKSLSHLLRGT